jgi:hypothetical protein
MKKLVMTPLFLLILICSYSQNPKIENEIRQIEEKRVSAIVKRDTAALSKIWAPDYFANRPAGRISPRDKVLELIVTDTLNLTSYKSEIEQIIVKPTFVITMGSEIVTPAGRNPNAGKILKRRFTHIWSNEDKNWRLLARHASILCE